MGDDEAQAAKLSWLPSLPASVCVCVCVCVFKVGHWACNVNKCHVIFAEALCRLGVILENVFVFLLYTIAPEDLLSVHTAAFFRRSVSVKDFCCSTHCISINTQIRRQT